MKRYGNLYPQILDFENLLLAARKAQRGKRYRPPVLEFNDRLESNLLQLQRELRDRTYQPGAYKTFEIYEPKRRQIAAAPYRDRVVHHALCNIIVPLFDRTFIATSYANRTGYGTHRALRQFVRACRRYRYVLQCDIRQYFPSIDLTILKQQLRRKLKCADTLWLLDRILDNRSTTDLPNPPVYFPGDTLLTPLERPTGLPIGNLTSQFLANVHLSGFDRYIKQTLRVPVYLRYVDDFALFADDRHFLKTCRDRLETYLATLRLRIHPIKSQLFETKYGANFVGFRVFRDRLRIRSHNLRLGRHRLKQLQANYTAGTITADTVRQSLQSWIAHLEHGDTWQLRQQIFANLDLPLPLNAPSPASA
ncbi:MAG: RNA-directed DNA polymerase [Coleofasciculaceae cyanobacterium RL_1_1]|nr:RNA-directed DNA polymerase [Coleofasciculaceae cyanobacterium RL_1_1]